MSKTNIQRLPNSFFRENPLEEMSAALLACANALLARASDAEAALNKTVAANLDDARAARVAHERQQIERADDPAVLIDLMRKCDLLNGRVLSARVAAHAEQTMPLLLKKYRTCLQDEFIEQASLALMRSDLRYTQQLRELYPQIRAPYAQAHACLTFGMQEMTQEIPFLLEQYRRFQRDYPTEAFSQFPLLALYLLHRQRLNVSLFPGLL